MARTKSEKKTYAVKLTLTESLYNELNDRAARQGITTAAWVTYVIGEKLAAIKHQEDTTDRLSREIMSQFSQMTMDKLTAMIDNEKLDEKILESSKDYLKYIADSYDKTKMNSDFEK